MTNDIKERKALLKVKYMSPEQVEHKTDKIIVSILNIVDEAINRGQCELKDTEAIRLGLLVMGLRQGDKPRVYRKIQCVEKQVAGLLSIIKIREELEIQRQINAHAKELESKIETLSDVTRSIKS